MNEIYGNMFSNENLNFADAICITTNGIVKKNGRAVMGAGVAKSAAQKFNNIDYDFGQLLLHNGHYTQIIKDEYVNNKKVSIISFPTKFHFKDKSDLELIEKSVKQLLMLAIRHLWQKIILPRPGCLNGGLNWETEVKPLLKEYLDERFYIISL